MKRFSVGNITYETATCYENIAGDLYKNLQRYLEGKFREYISEHARACALTDQILLINTHGRQSAKGWVYFDGKKCRSVNQKIAQEDGRFACIICAFCNEAQVEIRAKKSLVMIPSGAFSWWEVEHERVAFSILHPKQHITINDSTIDCELAVLRSKRKEAS